MLSYDEQQKIMNDFEKWGYLYARFHDIMRRVNVINKDNVTYIVRNEFARQKTVYNVDFTRGKLLAKVDLDKEGTLNKDILDELGL